MKSYNNFFSQDHCAWQIFNHLWNSKFMLKNSGGGDMLKTHTHTIALGGPNPDQE